MKARTHPWIVAFAGALMTGLLTACASAGSSEVDFLNPPSPVEPLAGMYVFQARVPVYGTRGGDEVVEGELTVSNETFHLSSTHGTCAGELQPDQPGRQRVRCQGIELDLEWVGSRWEGRVTAQVVEADEEEVCIQRDPTGGCAQMRVETRQRPVRRSADIELTRLGGGS